MSGVERLRLRRRSGRAGPSRPGEVELYYDATIRQLRLVDEAGQVFALASGGGGVSAHDDLTALGWASSGHTGTASRLAGFDSGGVAAYYQIGASGGVMGYDAGLTSLAAADGALGLPYVSAANTWTSVGLGDLTVSAGQWRVATVDGVAAATVAGQRTAHEAAYAHTNIPTTDQKAGLAGSNGTPSGSNPYVTSSDPRLTGSSGGAAVAAVSEYGTGALGDLDLDGVNTYPGIVTLAGSTYTVDATVVLNCGSLTIDAGITLKPAGSPVRVLNLLTLNGTIDVSGGDASGMTAGTGASPALAPGLATGNVYSGGDTGATGTASNVPGGANTFTNSAICCGGQGGNGGKGVYAATTRAGGTAVLASSSVLAEHYHGELQMLMQIGRADSGTTRLYLGGGGGGAAGGNSVGSGTGTLQSGGGGGGAGIAAVYARQATFGASAQILADGGDGGNATYTTPGGHAGSGGGGGAGGGVVFLKVGEVVGTQQLPALYARAGEGGDGNSVGSGYGDGGNGGTGGRIYCIVANYTGSAPTRSNAGGAGGASSGTGGTAGSSGSTGAVNVYNSL